MDNINTGIRDQQLEDDNATDLRDSGDPKSVGGNPTNNETLVVNEQDQNRSVNTGDPEYMENVTGRTEEETPKDLNVSVPDENPVSEDWEGGAEVETPHKIERADETSTERKIPKM